MNVASFPAELEKPQNDFVIYEATKAAARAKHKQHQTDLLFNTLTQQLGFIAQKHIEAVFAAAFARGRGP